jgi:hypothetical protein
MLNWADFASLLVVLASAMTGATVAHEQKAASCGIAVSAVGGIVLGAPFALAASKLAYLALSRVCAARGEARTTAYIFLYVIVPLLSLIAASTATALLTVGALSYFQ